jgi:tripartite-type tricarboxylate transporter receptor subunit TctC
MMLSPAGPNVLYPHIYKTLGYKPLEDFIPVTTVFETASALVVRTSPAVSWVTPSQGGET